MIVDNRAGGNTVIGAQHVAKAAPDGYTLLMAIDSTLVMNQFLYKSLPYDPFNDFVPITTVTTTNEGPFQVRPKIRGLDSNRVLVLVDGERLNNGRTSTGQSGIEPGLVEPSQIETVEVVRGSGSVLYGTDALAGTINIITRDTPPRRDGGFHFGGLLNTFYTSNENGRRGNLAVNGSNKFFAFRVAQSLDRFDNYFAGDVSNVDLDNLRNEDLIVTDDGEVLNSQSHSSNSQATMRFFFNDTNTLKINYEHQARGEHRFGRSRRCEYGYAGPRRSIQRFFPIQQPGQVQCAI